MSSRKLFDGKSLLEMSKQGADTGKAQPAASEATPQFAATRMALRGATIQAAQREASVFVDPKRCRAWKHHDRHPAWYTQERCADLIESVPVEGQKHAGLARRIEGDPNFDYEVIYGMRRRYACEVTGKQFRIVVTEQNDAECVVLMHIENAEREDITPMERAISFSQYLRSGLFPSREEMGKRLRVRQGQITKMTYAASLFEHPTLVRLFPDPAQVPLENAYKVASLLQKDVTKGLVIKAAENLLKSAGIETRPAKDVLRVLAAAPHRSEKTSAFRQEYNVGKKGRVVVTRNARGKVTFAFPGGVAGANREEVLDAVTRIYDDLSK